MAVRILLALAITVCSTHLSSQMVLTAAARGSSPQRQQELEMPCDILTDIQSQDGLIHVTRERNVNGEKMCTVLASQMPQTMDEVLDGDELDAGAYATSVSPCDGQLVNKDMCLTRRQSEILKQYDTLDNFHSGRWKRKALVSVAAKWRNKVVPYEIKDGVFSANDTALIKSALREWESGTCITFRPATRSDTDKMVIQSGMECYSRIGRVGGSQELSLGTGICRTKRVILHELGHALGLIHEHQREDRDNYVSIITDNVRDNSLDQFNKISRNLVDVESTKYDYRSLMHYGKLFFSKDGLSVTIQTIDPNYQDVIGRVDTLSFSDFKSINLMYQCSELCPQRLVCLNGGYVGPNCECVCPDGTVSCSATKGSQTKNTVASPRKENLSVKAPRREDPIVVSSPSVFSSERQTPSRKVTEADRLPQDLNRKTRIGTESVPKYVPVSTHLSNLLNDNSVLFDSDLGINVTANQQVYTKRAGTSRQTQGQGQGQAQAQPHFRVVSRQVEHDRNIVHLYTSDVTATIQAIMKNGELPRGAPADQLYQTSQPAAGPDVRYHDYLLPQTQGGSVVDVYPQGGVADSLFETPMWMR